jgi:hypothetical protein
MSDDGGGQPLLAGELARRINERTEDFHRAQ